MNPLRIEAYSRQADDIERGPQVYGGPTSLTSLRAYRAHHPAARVQFLNVDGRDYWLTAKQMRIKAILDRTSGSSDQMTTMTAIAKEARTSVGYVSKVIVRFRQWSMIGALSSRGRWGGLFVWKVRKVAQRVARAISGFNVSSVLQGRGTTASKAVYTVETLKPWTREELAEVGL